MHPNLFLVKVFVVAAVTAQFCHAVSLTSLTQGLISSSSSTKDLFQDSSLEECTAILSLSGGSTLKSKRIPTLNKSDVSSFSSTLDSFEGIGFIAEPAAEKIDDLNAPEGDTNRLLKDITLLTDILGGIINREDKEVYEIFNEFRKHALARATGDRTALSKMVALSSSISPEKALGVTRAFTQTLNLINAAEVHHRMRRLRIRDSYAKKASPLPHREDSVKGAIENLLGNQDEINDLYKEETGESKFQIRGSQQQRKDAIYDALLNQKVDIVLTAHPTEVNRRTLLRKYRNISEILSKLDQSDSTSFERAYEIEKLGREIGSIWGSDEIRRAKPTPQQESKGGLAIIESVLWDAIPGYQRKLNAQCEVSLGKSLPLDHSPIVFSSWMGGDRDGNPNVTPKVTHEVAINQRMQAARLFHKDLTELYFELAICKGFSSDMVKLAKEVKESADRRELYRRVIGHILLRLEATQKWCEMELDLEGSGSELIRQVEQRVDEVSSLAHRDMPLFDSRELFMPLRVMHESLNQGGYGDIANGNLIDIIRRVAAFGLTMVPLDVRQESTRHANCIDAITRFLGLGSYASWDEETKLTWLQSELSSKRPLFRIRDIDSLGIDNLSVQTLRTFETLSNLGPGSLGAYVISMSRSASDVLAVMLLQKQFGMTAANGKLMRVVPLFETLDDLTNSPKIVETLFSLPAYAAATKGKQEIMVGYSDSAKDAGRLAAGWIQYEAQEQMIGVAEKYNIDLSFFHGKGGTVGRGGNPALYRAVLAHPPKTINGKFRVTEQGEMITQNFGSIGIAERTLDIYTSAVLAEKFVEHVEPKKEWREHMKKLSASSCQTYRSLIEQQRFISYFRSATPELELGVLNIGSRPAKRNPKGGIESLRAIPWQFAWTQTRLHLPAWLGVGNALDCSNDPKKSKELTEMYSEWPFFKEMVDLIAMTLSKTDYSISALYELQLCEKNDKELSKLGQEIRDELIRTRKAILSVTGCDDLSSGFKLLRTSMKVRNPYVDPLNVLQSEMMKRLRITNKAGEASQVQTDKNDDVDNILLPNDALDEKVMVEDTLIVSINGIAQGMKNSG